MKKMPNTSEIIGDYKGSVKNKVILALLQSYLDNLDYDGMKSILNEADMLYLKDIRDFDPEGTIDFFYFKKIISAQNCLLYESNELLFEIGKKLSFFLFPFGKNFEEIIKEINQLIVTDWKVEILKKEQDLYVINVEKCVFCSEIGVSCDLFKGFLIHSLEKTLSTDYTIVSSGTNENINDPLHNNFILKLKIEKSIK